MGDVTNKLIFFPPRILIQIYEDLYAIFIWFVTLKLHVIYKLFVYIIDADNNM